MSHIKDCPFCGKGSEPFYELDTQWQDRHVIECGDCGKQARYEYSEKGAIDLWNCRPIEDELKQAINQYAKTKTTEDMQAMFALAGGE